MTDRRITAESVAEVADRLSAEGQPVSNRAIIAVLGGSHRDVGPLLTAWREARQEQEKLQSIEVPEPLSRAAGELVAGLWRDAMRAATAGHEGMRVQITTLTQRLDAQAADHADELEELSGDLEQARMDRQAALDAARLATVEKDEARGELTAARAQIATLEGQANLLHARLDLLMEQVADARGERDRLRQERDAAREQAEAMRREMVEQVAAARAETDAVRKAGEAQAAKLRADLDAAREEVSSARGEASSARGERDVLRESLAASERRATAAEARADQEETRAREASERAALAEAEVARLNERLAAVRPVMPEVGTTD